jgi:O-antigen/teichoic acid export membrane protein
VRGTALAFGAKLVGGLFTAAIVVFLSRRLGPTGYGVFALALSVATLVELPSDFGIAVSLPRFIAEHRDDRQTVIELLADAIRLKLLGSVIVAGALAALAGAIATAYHTPGLSGALRGMAIALVGQSFVFLFAGVFGALRRQKLSLIMNLAESAMELTATVVLVLLAGGATAAAFGCAVGYAFGAATGVVLAVRLVGSGMLRGGLLPRRHARRIATYAGAVFIVDGAFTAFGQIDAVLIGGFLSATSVGLWQAPLRLIVFLMYPGQAVAMAVVPRLARSARREREIRPFTAALRLMIVVMSAITAVTMAWAGPIIRIVLGSSFATSAGVLRALAPYVFLSGLVSLVSGGMNIIGAARRRIPFAIATLLVNLVLDLILIPRIGVLGGAVGTDVAFCIYVPAHLFYCRRALGIALRPIALTLARGLLAGSAMGLVLFSFGTDHLSLLAVVLGATLGAAAFAAVLLLTRELSPADLRRARAALRRRPSGR